MNLASVMVMEPEILILDEPTSQLDPVAANDFFQMIEKINRELGTTVLMTEHRLEEVFSLCSHVCVLEQGRVLCVDTPQRVASLLYEKKHPLAEALPAAARMCLLCQKDGQPEQEKEGGSRQLPLTVNEGRFWLKSYMEANEIASGIEKLGIEKPGISASGQKKPEKMSSHKSRELALFADEIWFRYEKDGSDILKACSLQLQKGCITAILGGNGAGKSTLLNVLSGHYPTGAGKVKKVSGTIGMLPQNPQAMFAKKTVEEELLVSNGKERENSGSPYLEQIIDFCDLKPVLKQHPFDLSGGQMQKLALAKLLLEDKDILLLDEPGKGMDNQFKEQMGVLLKTLVAQGKTVLMVSHDVEFCARYADCCGLFFDGQIVALEESRSFFLQNTFYTTSVSRICRNQLPEAVIMEDVLHKLSREPEVAACEKPDKEIPGEIQKSSGVKETSGEEQKNSEVKEISDEAWESSEVKETSGEAWESSEVKETSGEIRESSGTKETSGKTRKCISRFLSLGIIFFVMPLTIYIGHTLLAQRKYYFISLLLVLEALAAFFLGFEKRKPRVREIMVIAVYSAIVVASRMALYMVPNVKPMAALVIIAGVGLGREAGFLVGAMSMLVSNIFFGQGPWTPWQMFAMGLMGFLAGSIFKQDTECTTKKKYGMCLFGLLAVLVGYGGIMNTASVLMYQENVNWHMLVASCVAGLPFDMMHAIATFCFLWVGARPMLEKMSRIRKCHKPL